MDVRLGYLLKRLMCQELGVGRCPIFSSGMPHDGEHSLVGHSLQLPCVFLTASRAGIHSL